MKVICIDDSDYPVSLKRGNIYEVIPDEYATTYNQYKLRDETGEVYYFLTSYFEIMENA